MDLNLQIGDILPEGGIKQGSATDHEDSVNVIGESRIPQIVDASQNSDASDPAPSNTVESRLVLVENSYPKDQIDQHFANQITGDEIQDYFSSENSTKITFSWSKSQI